MEFCFGRRGLIAISVFQFVFAFGGMFQRVCVCVCVCGFMHVGNVYLPIVC